MARATNEAGWPRWRVDLAIALGVGLLAAGVRWPHLWTVPRLTDETLEVLHSLAIVRDGARPLTNYDSYYGALYNYLIAAALAIGGESPFAPRVVVLLVGALTVAATYFVGRELGLRLPPDWQAPTSPPSPPPLKGSGVWGARVVGLVAASLLATNGPHVVVNSHVAWSNCLTPLFTTLAFLALLRCGRVAGGRGEAARGGGRWGLPLAGLLFGLALQTHPLVAALLPGAAGYVLWKARRATAGIGGLLRSIGPYLGVACFLIGYGNVVLYNAATGFESVWSAQRIRGEYALDRQAAGGVLPTAGAMLQMLARVLGGAVDQRGGSFEYLADPMVIVVAGLTVGGLWWSARRGEPLPLLVSGGFLLLLPLFNPKFGTLLTARYLMPIAPLLFAAAGLALVGFGGLAAARVDPSDGRVAAIRVGVAAVVVVGLLVLAPLWPLGRYYERAFERSDTNERIFRLTDEIWAARRPDELVLIDETIGSELPDTGVTELRGFEYLLRFGRVPHRAVRISPQRLREELRGSATALAVLNARDAAAVAEQLTLTPLDPRAPATTGRMSDFRLYRVGGRQASADR
jgi:4-amino-4-deoxy-L-arabinose transferase-like glycosyltransferase